MSAYSERVDNRKMQINSSTSCSSSAEQQLSSKTGAASSGGTSAAATAPTAATYNKMLWLPASQSLPPGVIRTKQPPLFPKSTSTANREADMENSSRNSSRASGHQQQRRVRGQQQRSGAQRLDLPPRVSSKLSSPDTNGTENIKEKSGLSSSKNSSTNGSTNNSGSCSSSTSGSNASSRRGGADTGIETSGAVESLQRLPLSASQQGTFRGKASSRTFAQVHPSHLVSSRSSLKNTETSRAPQLQKSIYGQHTEASSRTQQEAAPTATRADPHMECSKKLAAAAAAVPQTQVQQQQQVERPTTEGVHATTEVYKAKLKTKVVVRLLPPSVTEEELLELLSDEQRSKINWRKFYPGRLQTSAVAGGSTIRHAVWFLNCVSAEAAEELIRSLHGKVFLDEKHMLFKIVARLAPYQKVPRKKATEKKREGLIENDPLYISFLKSLESNESANSSSSTTSHGPVELETIRDDDGIALSSLILAMRKKHGVTTLVRGKPYTLEMWNKKFSMLNDQPASKG